MDERRLTTPQKIIVWSLLIFALWRILQIPSVIEAVLTFALAGEIPGTNIVLAPDTIIRGAGLILLFIGSMLASKPLIAARAHRKQIPKAPPRHFVYTSDKDGRIAKIPAAPAYHPPRITEGLPQAIRSFAGWVHYRFIVDYYAIKSDLRKLILWISDRLAEFWQWLEPLLWRFDAWLGMQYRALVKELQRKLNIE